MKTAKTKKTFDPGRFLDSRLLDLICVVFLMLL